ncbi:MAG: hypothetical protein J6Y43_02280, partial [Clostridia bacterium]|nr:hypothetical protein [Clostridia bacterium]
MKKKLTIIVLLALIAAIMIPATFAWIADNSATDFGITSYVHKSYFESGDGTSAVQYSGNEAELGYNDEGCAFEIKYPVQFYYFTWLQYMGYFNQAKTEEGHTTEINQVYFYLSADLYMDGWILPPVGTDEFPFLGSFNGNGHTIHNLTVQNVLTTNVVSATTLNDIPESIGPVEIVGLFGVVGSPSTIGTANASYEYSGNFVSTDEYEYTYNVANNEIKNFNLDGITIKANAATNRALIGAVAGYLNANVAHADVIDATLCLANGTSAIVGKTNVSDYSVIGYNVSELSSS